MQIVTPNPKLVEAMAASLFTDSYSLSTNLWQGIQVITASDFQEHIARKYTADHLLVCGEFFRNFLGQYKQVAIDYLNSSIRLFNLIGTEGIEGVQLSISPHKIELLKISHVCGTQVAAVIQTWQV